MNDKFKSYSELDFGTRQAAPIPTETIVITIGTNELADRYVEALLSRIVEKANSVLMELTSRQRQRNQVELNKETLLEYLNYLLQQRCDFVAGECREWNRLKALWIPSYWQFVLSMIGEYRDRKFGLRFIPRVSSPSSWGYTEALQISEQLAEFEDVIHIERSAMPTSVIGDAAVMTSAIIVNKVRSMSDSVHPAMQYVVAMANIKLQQETAFATLYRIQYDDVQNLVYQATMREFV